MHKNMFMIILALHKILIYKKWGTEEVSRILTVKSTLTYAKES